MTSKSRQVSLKICRVLHAGYLFECDETRILFDPIFENPFSVNCFAFPPVRFDLPLLEKERFSAVFISHFHDDHCSLKSLNLLDRRTPIFIYCLHGELMDWIRDLGFRDVRQLRLDVEIEVGPFKITPRRAFDADVDSLFQIRVGELNILNVVDSLLDSETLSLLKKESPWNLVLWPFQMMRELAVIAPTRTIQEPVKVPDESIDELASLKPHFVVPSSCQFVHEPWSWYNHALFPMTYRQFTDEVHSRVPGTRVVRMDPGTSFLLDGTSFSQTESLKWVQPCGEQNVDFDYQPERLPTSTSEIAKCFPPLSHEERDRVHSYCVTELPRIYRSLDVPEFFREPRVWLLCLFDEAGKESRFYYRIEMENVELLPTAVESIAWKTEVIITKLFAALERGETMSSMYLRVNDHRFDPRAEEALGEAEVLDDPLIRTLFTGQFGAYQLAQLKDLEAESL